MGMLGQQQTLRWKNTATKGEKKFGKEKKNWTESLKERKRNWEREIAERSQGQLLCVTDWFAEEEFNLWVKQKGFNPLISTYNIQTL